MSATIDPILGALVRVVERRALDGLPLLHIPLVVHVGSTFIYGDLIPASMFQEHSKRFIKTAFEAFEEAETAIQFDFELKTSEAMGNSFDFIHLAKACFSGPVGEQEPDPATTTEMWRGKLSSIDGWTNFGSG